MITINLYNHKSQLTGPRKYIEEVREKYKLRKKNYFWSQAYRKGYWDGYIRYISDVNGLVATGLIPEVCELMKQSGIPFEIVDKRDRFKPLEVVTTIAGDDLRDYQIDAVKACIHNKLYGIRFTRGICLAATNAGKSYIMAAVFASYSDKRRGILLIDNSEIYAQLVEDFRGFFPDEVGCIDSSRLEFDRRITVCMVQTLSNRTRKMTKVVEFLSQQDIVIVDECDTCTTSYYKTVLDKLHNASVRLGFTGTFEMNKDKTKDKEVTAYFGSILYRISNQDLIKKGVSTKPIIKMFSGSDGIKVKGDWKAEYDTAIVNNKKRNRKVWKRAIANYDKGRLPMVIMFKYKEHAKKLMKLIPQELSHLTIDYVHSGISDGQRAKIISRFKEGKLDILLASFILKRGKNLPLMKVLINAAGGDSQTNLVQILGRLLRSHKSKKRVYLEDFFDGGSAYLMRWSKHRIRHYKAEGFEVKELYKK